MPTFTEFSTNSAADTKSLSLTSTSSQYVDVGNPASLNFNYNTPFTLNAWVYVNAATTMGQATIMAKEAAAPTYTGYYFGWTSLGVNGALSVALLDNSPSTLIDVYTSVAMPPTMTWQMLTATYDGSGKAAGISIYMNGVPQTIVTVYDSLNNNSIQTTAHFTIGGTPTTSRYSNIYIDEVSVWGTVLAPPQIVTLYNGGYPGDPRIQLSGLLGDLISYWPIGEGPDTSSTMYDLVGNNNGTLTNGPTYSTNVP